jgi:ubiquinone/menaquinone biosynthesis C-methylase UbiE
MLISSLDRLRYRLQHQALLLLLGPPMAAWHLLVGPRLPRPGAAALEALRARLESLLESDLDCVERGVYPRTLLFQFPAIEYLSRLPRLLSDVPRVAWRIQRSAYAELPQDLDLSGFPRYYRRTFHWQSDGWLSTRSADLYDLEVEALFAGTGDVMRRRALAPLADALHGRSRPRVLDIGCGTGRFLRQLLEALPDAHVWGLDLSPFYLARAHELLAGARPVSLVAENAEQMPFHDDYFDAATGIFLLHELPPAARRRVLREARRVLAPDARLVLCDAAQLSDSPELRPFLEAFPRLYHEPYFKSYLRDDLAKLLSECGFEVESEQPAFLARVVVARNAS